MQEALVHVVDPYSPMKLPLWADFVDSVSEGKQDTSLRTSKYIKINLIAIYMLTHPSLVPAQPFTDVLPITEEIPSEHISTTVNGEILEVEKCFIFNLSNFIVCYYI